MKVLKPIVLSFIIVMFVFCFKVVSYAALVDNGDGTVTQYRDDGITLMWLQDTYLGGNFDTWSAASSWVDTLDYASYNDWRLPSAFNSDGSGPCGPGESCPDTEMGYLFHIEGITTSNQDPFLNLDSWRYVTSYCEYNTAYIDNNLCWVYRFAPTAGGVGAYDAFNFRAWAVRDVAVVPEPISSILFVTGGTLLAGRRYLKRKKKA